MLRKHRSMTTADTAVLIAFPVMALSALYYYLYRKDFWLYPFLAGGLVLIIGVAVSPYSTFYLSLFVICGGMVLLAVFVWAWIKQPDDPRETLVFRWVFPIAGPLLILWGGNLFYEDYALPHGRVEGYVSDIERRGSRYSQRETYIRIHGLNLRARGWLDITHRDKVLITYGEGSKTIFLIRRLPE